jgi:hypothetical protein
MTAAGLTHAGAVRWGTSVPLAQPGVYVIALAADPDDATATVPVAPIDPATIQTLLDRRPELAVDDSRPSPDELARRLAAFWLPDEVIVYIGLAGTSVRTRIDQYYATRLGARSPHAGGWFLKTLSVLDDLWVHYAAASDPDRAEAGMLAAFSAAVSPATAAGLHDSERLMPFANLEWPKRRRKRHGITGAKAPRGATVARATGAPSTRPGTAHATAAPQPASSISPSAPREDLVSQRITEKDLAAGQVRFPRASKAAFPSERCAIVVRLLGHELQGRWDPRNGPDRERSGVLRLGEALRDVVVEPGRVFEVHRVEGGVALG